VRAVILYAKLAPFHKARLATAARLFAARSDSLACIEIAAAQSSYRWDTGPNQAANYTSQTLFEDSDYADIGTLDLWGRLHQSLADLQPDVVVVNGWGFRESWMSVRMLLRSGQGVVVVSDSHLEDHPRWWFPEGVKRWFLRCCHAAFVAGAPQQRYLEALGFSQDSCFSGCDVVDNALFAEGPPVIFPAEPTELKLISCIRLLPHKNLVGAAQALAKAKVPWRWTIAGEGPERDVLMQEIAQLGLGDRIQLVGRLDYPDLAAFHRTGHIYLQPSLSEPWGLAVNEAMASGLPVLVSKQCGCHEDLVHDGANGYSFDAADPNQLVLGVHTLWEKRGEWDEMGAASRRIIAPWSLDLFAENLHAACVMAMAKSHARRA